MAGLIVCLVILFLLLVAGIWALIYQRNFLKELRQEILDNLVDEQIKEGDNNAKRN